MSSLKEEAHPLFSRTMVLILASVLVGMGVGQVVHHRFVLLLMLAGITGLLAFIALEFAAYQRLQRRHDTTTTLRRIEQHLRDQSR